MDNQNLATWQMGLRSPMVPVSDPGTPIQARVPQMQAPTSEPPLWSGPARLGEQSPERTPPPGYQPPSQFDLLGFLQQMFGQQQQGTPGGQQGAQGHMPQFQLPSTGPSTPFSQSGAGGHAGHPGGAMSFLPILFQMLQRGNLGGQPGGGLGGGQQQMNNQAPTQFG